MSTYLPPYIFFIGIYATTFTFLDCSAKKYFCQVFYFRHTFDRKHFSRQAFLRLPHIFSGTVKASNFVIILDGNIYFRQSFSRLPHNFSGIEVYTEGALALDNPLKFRWQRFCHYVDICTELSQFLFFFNCPFSSQQPFLGPFWPLFFST